MTASFPIRFCLAGLLLAAESSAFTYVTTNRGANSPDTVVHPCGYDGSGGELTVTLGLHPQFQHLETHFQFSGEQAVAWWNQLLAVTGNLSPSLEIPSQGGTDILGTLIHEFGHTLGLAHPTFVPPAGIRGDGGQGKYATALPGENGRFDLEPGEDGMRGSADDPRGDDVNLMWFKKADNNPFTLPESDIIDSTTYSRKLEDLPEGDNSPVAPSRENALGIHGLEDTEAMMVSGGSLIPGQVRRGLGADDIAGIRYAMSGVDEIQGTKDDYTIRLEYVGVSADADVIIRFDLPDGYAAASFGGQEIAPNHRVMPSGQKINYCPDLAGNRGWFFPYPDPLQAEISKLNPRAVSLTFGTEVGHRYAVTWPEMRSKGPILMQHDGNSVLPTTGSLYLFIAKSPRTEVKIAFPEDAIPPLDEVKANVMRTREP